MRGLIEQPTSLIIDDIHLIEGSESVNRTVTPWFAEQEFKLSQLYQTTEGWPAGTQLTLLAQQHNTNSFYSQSLGINHQTIDYLTAQAINQLGPPLLDFYLKPVF